MGKFTLLIILFQLHLGEHQQDQGSHSLHILKVIV